MHLFNLVPFIVFSKTSTIGYSSLLCAADAAILNDGSLYHCKPDGTMQRVF